MSKMIIGLAPMDGYTDCAFRQIVKEIFLKYGEQDKYELFLRTEFMNADGYIINPLGVLKHLMTTSEHTPVIAQIFGGNEDMLVKCFEDIQQKYFNNWKLKIKNWKSIFSWIELNMGCPARNVMSTWWWSALLKDKTSTLKLIKTLSWILKVPFSIKTRTGLYEEDKKLQMEFLVEASKYVSMITIHGRTVKQWYTWNADWEFIYEFKKKADNKCKIIGNGAMKDYEDIKQVQWNLDWIMIGQSAIGNPRIFTPYTPTRQELKKTILKHLDLMLIYESYFQQQKEHFDWTFIMPSSTLWTKSIVQSFNRSTIIIPEFRKHLFQYVKGIPWSKEFKQEVSTISEYEPLVEKIQKFFSE